MSEMTEPALEDLVACAVLGDKGAAKEVVLRIQDPIYGLALRILGHPADAEDASQEILMVVLTHLASFRGESAFRTWVFRVAARRLLRIKRGRLEHESFEVIEERIRQGSAVEASTMPEAELSLLAREVEIGCTQAMLLSLDRDERLAFVLAEVFELSGDEAAGALEIEPSAYRKRLSRARTRLTEFIKRVCGLVDADNACRCARQVPIARAAGLLDPARLLYATHPERGARREAVAERAREVAELHRLSFVYRQHPDYAAPDRLRRLVDEMLDAEKFRLFH